MSEIGKVVIMKNLTDNVRQELLELAERFGLTNVRLFGSVARGEDHARSDLDVVACFPPGFTLLRHARLEREMGELIGCPVDLVSEFGMRPRLRETVREEAIPL
ncbi:MAG: nucleotidyltransferase family protein [Candidatus Sumerlaeota bacterium]